jgi:poly-beta-1,6 N-acetyl-D-glucosamine synthase
MALLAGLGMGSFGVYRLIDGITPTPTSGFVRVCILGLFACVLVLLLRHLTLLSLSFLHLLRGEPDSSPAYPLVSAIVPAFNEGIVIQAAIRSLIQLDYPKLEILIIDDGSTDDTGSKAAAYEGQHGGVRIRVVQQRNEGKARALNAGIRSARGALVLCVDGDSILSPDCLRRAVRHFSDPSVGAVSGNVKVVNRTNLLSRLQALEYVEGLNFVRNAQAYFRIVNIVPGPLGLFRRSALLDAGGYESDTFAEDCDLTLRLLATGWKIAYEPSALAYTEAPEHLLDLAKQRYRWTRGILQAMRKQTRHLVYPRASLAVTLSLWHMSFEGFVWPFMNVSAHLLFVGVGLTHGLPGLLLLWWVLLALLDLTAALYCVLIEGERLTLVPYAVPYRVFFALTIDVFKLGATVEELLSIPMEWGKLQRVGRI